MKIFFFDLKKKSIIKLIKKKKRNIYDITMDDDLPILPFTPPEEVRRVKRKKKKYYQKNR